MGMARASAVEPGIVRQPMRGDFPKFVLVGSASGSGYMAIDCSSSASSRSSSVICFFAGAVGAELPVWSVARIRRGAGRGATGEERGVNGGVRSERWMWRVGRGRGEGWKGGARWQRRA